MAQATVTEGIQMAQVSVEGGCLDGTSNGD